MRVLIVEDEERLARNLKRGIESLPSFVADVLYLGTEARDRLLSGEPYDLLLLDRILPDMDGLDLLLALREKGLTLPVLVLTALDEKKEVVKGLNYGCDDYLAKPFDMGELLARCKALIRRNREQPVPVIALDDLVIDTNSHQVTRGARRIELTPLEYRLLEYLAFHPGRVVSKTELLEHLYDYNWEKFSNVIEHFVSALRRKLESDGEARLIHTHRAQGYRLGGDP